jgi:hypothetical protein
MEQLDNFYGYFNIVLGTIFILIGFRIYKPFNKEKEEEIYKKYINLYRFGGIGLLIWGLIKVF